MSRVRRIQEIVFRQEAVVVEELGSGGEGIEEPLEIEPLDPLLPLEVVTALPAGWDQREYVWGPDYVDELAWEIAHPKSAEQQQAHPNGLAYYAALDANYNVMALLRSTATGAGETIPSQGGTGVNGAFVPGDVAVQYVWSPYGECLASEVFDDAAPLNPVGHQGLFYVRLNGKVTDRPHEPYHAGFYYNRNRMYEPASGRFVQRDMNATGMPVLADAAFHGFPIIPMSDPYDAMGSYGDGMSLFAYLGGNPLSRSDPMGLNYGDVLTTSFIHGLLGSMVNGALQGAMHQSWSAAGQGAAVGFLAGAAGGAFSAYGWAAAAFAGGATQGYYQSLGDERSAQQNMVDAMFGGMVSTATGGLLNRLGGWGGPSARMIRGLYGEVAETDLMAAMSSGGATVRLVTGLTGPPQAGRSLHVAVGDGGDALAGAAGGGRNLYEAQVPRALLNLMEQAGLLRYGTTSMNGVVGTEIRFEANATEFIVPFFR